MINPRSAHCRSGAALLVVLAAVVLTTTVLSTLAATAHRRHAARTASLDSELAADLLRQADALANRWLTDTSASIVLPPESPSPRVHLPAHELALAGKTVTITLTAFDQHGMVPSQASTSLGSTLPVGIQALHAQMIDRRAREPYGLDQIAAFIPAGSQQRAYPCARLDDQHALQLAAGELLATHGGTPRPAINPSTAPIPLVAAALREAGLGGLEHVIEARSNGRPVPLGRLIVLGDDGGERTIELVPSSRCWAVRTDLTIGSHRQSWWSIWQRGGSGWTMSQRLRITQ